MPYTFPARKMEIYILGIFSLACYPFTSLVVLIMFVVFRHGHSSYYHSLSWRVITRQHNASLNRKYRSLQIPCEGKKENCAESLQIPQPHCWEYFSCEELVQRIVYMNVQGSQKISQVERDHLLWPRLMLNGGPGDDIDKAYLNPCLLKCITLALLGSDLALDQQVHEP